MVAPFSADLLQDSRKGDPGFVEQRRSFLEQYLRQLLFRIEVLLEYEPFLTFIAVTEHLEHLETTAQRRDTDRGEGQGGASSPDRDIDSGVFARSQTSTGSTHGVPVGKLICQATGVAIDEGNYVEYQTAPSMGWGGAGWCEAAVQELIETQFEVYLGGLSITAENAAELTAAMVSGLRVWLCDPKGLPLPMGDTHVCRVWYASDGKERSGRLLQTGPRATRMRRLAEGLDSDSDGEGAEDMIEREEEDEGGGAASDLSREQRLERLRAVTAAAGGSPVESLLAPEPEPEPEPEPPAIVGERWQHAITHATYICLWLVDRF